MEKVERRLESIREILTEMATLSRESRTSLDSGFADELKTRKTKIKMKKKVRKFTKNDISEPLGELKHLAHISTSGDSFGDISADLSKAVFDSDCLNKALIEKKSMSQTSTSLPGAITPSFSLKSEHNINFGSQDADMNFEKISKGKTTSFSRLPMKSPETIRRNHSETLEPAKIETCRKSTISFNFDIGIDSDDILTSVLAVMDKLNTTRLNEDFTNGNIVPEERIYDEVPPLETIASETSRSVTITVERTETTTAHMKQSSSRDKIIKRPNRPPPSPKTSNSISCSLSSGTSSLKQ